MKNFWISILFFTVVACSRNEKRFTRLMAEDTGVTFINSINETDSFNVFTNEYIYNGAGVGAGDINNDGLVDLFFAGNVEKGRLYLNKGAFQFEDITAAAGIDRQYWTTGVAFTDINADGRMDIYLSSASADDSHQLPNLFYINEGTKANGIPYFREAAAVMNLDDTAYHTQAAFFDYDLDGDLDVYLCVNSIKERDRNAIRGQNKNGEGISQDKLYRNEGIQHDTGLPVFTNVSASANILIEGWGLGVITKDFNRDGWPDIYVANDFQSNDILYINNRDGTFSNQIDKILAHQSHNSMGVDMADFNNDGLEDLCVVDMLPEDNLRQKTMFGPAKNDKYDMALKLGYQPQFVRNVLQLNNGLLADSFPSFSDIGYMAGIAATDWSWSPLWADFDLDGWRDLLITNGYVRDITDLDFTTYASDYNAFGTKESKISGLRKKAKEMGSVKKPNWLFHNEKDLSFSNKAAEWGIEENTFSSGAVYADLDNDGDLDIVISNLNDPAFIYRNNTNEWAAAKKIPKNNYLILQLKGTPENPFGIGAQITLLSKEKKFFAEHCMQRGYLSSMDEKIHFGLGDIQMIDSVLVKWPGGKSQLIKRVKANQLLMVKQENAISTSDFTASRLVYFVDRTRDKKIDYTHSEISFPDFNYQFTIPHKYSQSGPAVAVADINGDGLEDAYVGGSTRKSGYFLIQHAEGFKLRPLYADATKKLQEETGCLLFDADNDGDNDLYTVAGSNEFGDSLAYQDLFYLNDGKGNFTLKENVLPPTTGSGTAIAAADYDHDGDLDLFIGGGVKPRFYPQASRSYFLRNDIDPVSGKIVFTDVTASMHPALVLPGIVKAVLFTDYNNDGYADLLLTGEFMPLLLFENDRRGSFSLVKVPGFNHSEGWYNSLLPGDFDNDGDMDYVAGNLGKNSRFQSTPDQPVTVRYNDFNKDGNHDAFLFAYLQGKEYPVHTKTTMVEQIPALNKKMYYFSDFGKMGYTDIFNEQQREGTKSLSARLFASIYIQNNGKGNFAIQPLPMRAQTAPVTGMLAIDVDGDGWLDIVAQGNDYSPEAISGRYDASVGWILSGNGKGQFTCMEPSATGLALRGDNKAMAAITMADGRAAFISSQNKGALRLVQLNRPHQIVSFKSGETYAEISLRNGTKRRIEKSIGSGYLSQSGNAVCVTLDVASITFFAINGTARVWTPSIAKIMQ